MEVSAQLHIVATVPAENNPGTHWMGGCMSKSACGHFWEEKILFHLPALKSQGIQPIVTAVADNSDFIWC